MTDSVRPDLDWLAELNPEQREAVCHQGGPLLVVAGAGTGKTRTLAYRVAYLVATGVHPRRILLLTFTRRAAEEMIRRAEALLNRGEGAAGKVWGGTFHATANRLLRIHAESIGLSGNFTVLDQADAEGLMDLVRHSLDLHSRERRFPRKATCLAIYSRVVNGAEALGEVLSRFFPWCSDWESELKSLFRLYVERKQQRDLLDFDDLLLYFSELVSETRLAERVAGRFDHVLVDEYQDTNPLQAKILKGLCHRNPNIMVVGDDAQSIYRFRGATVENMFDFPNDFPGTTIVTLGRNYRSVMPILETTNQVIRQARNRYTKDLWSERESGQRPRLVTCEDETTQDNFVIERVLEHYEEGVALRRQAVLFRAGWHSNSLEVELARRNIPFRKYGGLRFLEAAHVKDLLGFLRILENPRDELAWFRVLQLISGVGPATAAKVFRHLSGKDYDPTSIQAFAAPAAAREGLAKLAALFESLRTSDGAHPAEEVARVRRAYEPFLKELYDNPTVRAHDLENLESIAARYRSRQRFLVDLQLDPPESTADLAGPGSKDEDWLVLSTIHSAKGCEWDAVYLIHASDGCLPSDLAADSPEELDEELRLAYVAMTRARDHLYVTWPFRYYHRRSFMSDRHSYAQLSRFLSPEVRVTMEESSAGRTGFLDDPEQDLVEDIRSRLRSFWE